MSAIEIIKRRLKEDRIPETPEEVGHKKKRPRVSDTFHLWLRKPNIFKLHALIQNCALPPTMASLLSLPLPSLEN